MSEFAWIEEIIVKNLGSADVKIQDMTGTKDHLEITITSSAFTGKSLIQQHRLVMNALSEYLKTNQIHAVKLNTKSP